MTKARAPFLFAAVFATGAASLALEVIAGRLLSPLFGASIYVWSASIVTTLAALALGYGVGGRWADRSQAPRIFCRLLALSALAVAAIPFARVPVLQATADLDVRLGTLICAACFLGPALFTLGALNPIAVRLSTSSLAGVGRGSGDVYQASTFGGVAGALATGFLLIPALPITPIIYAIAALLALLAACSSLILTGARSDGAIALAAAIAAASLLRRPSPPPDLLFETESAYSRIEVVQGARAPGRLLVFGGALMSYVVDSPSAFPPYLEPAELGPALRPAARDALVLGLGGGALTRMLEGRFGLSVDSVELDPEVARIARDYFGFSSKGRVFIGDGRRFLDRNKKRYGLVFLDASHASSMPYYLYTRESFSAMRRALAPGGLLSVNCFGLLRGQSTAPWLSAYKTLRDAFPYVRAFAFADVRRPPQEPVTVLLFASDRPIAIDPSSLPALHPDTRAMLSNELTPSPDALARAPVMSDERPLMDTLLAESARSLKPSKRLLPALLYQD